MTAMVIHLGLLLLWLSGVWTAAGESPFIVVFIDNKTEETVGPFPLNRSVLAKGIHQLKRDRARGVVLKFFFDQPKDAGDDAALAEAIAGLPVLLQARLDDAEPKPNPLPERFVLKTTPAAGPSGLAGRSGWIPLPCFSDRARDIGFVDLTRPDCVPVVEFYQGRAVKSLSLCALELALNEQAHVVSGRSFRLHGRVIPLDEGNAVRVQLPAKDTLAYIPFHDLVAAKVSAGTFAGKVVILGYDGAKIHSLKTPVGDLKAHRLFVHGLEALYRQLTD